MRLRVGISLRPVRASRDAKALFAGFLLSWLGRQVTVVAVPFQIYSMTRSSLLVGLLGLFQFGPLVLASLGGGAVADAWDRRRLLRWSQVGLLATAFALVANSVLDEPLLWPLYVLTAINGALQAVDSPARSAALPRIVGHALLAESVVLMQTLGTLAKAVGPLIGGALLATGSLPLTFGASAAMFVVSFALVSLLEPIPPPPDSVRPGLRSIAEGFRFVRGRPFLIANFGIDLNAMVFGMPSALFPEIALEVLPGGSAATVGLLYAAPGVGSLLAALTSGWVSGIRRQGRAVVIAVIVWGLAIAAFGFAPNVAVAVALLAVAGGADVVSAILRVTIIQLAVPDELRGRLFGMNVAVVASGPRLGDLEAGAVASLAGPTFSVVSGGFACVLGAVLIARRVPEYWRAETGDPGGATGSAPRAGAAS